MTHEDQQRWNERYRSNVAQEPALPRVFAAHRERFASASTAIELACGMGSFSLWLAQHGVSVVGYDVSDVAIDRARARAIELDVAERCRFEVLDLDNGLPVGTPVDLVVVHKFRDGALDRQLVERLVPGGTLAIAALSEVGATPGRFRMPAGELLRSFASLREVESGEADGIGWFVGTAA